MRAIKIDVDKYKEILKEEGYYLMLHQIMLDMVNETSQKVRFEIKCKTWDLITNSENKAVKIFKQKNKNQ